MSICNVKFYVGGREYKTLCNTVKNAESFRVKFIVAEHSVTAEISDKCHFKTIDGIELNGVKTDYHICKDYHTMRDFIYNLEDTFDTFIYTALHDEKILGSIDELLWTVTQFPHVVTTFNKNDKNVYEDFFELSETELSDESETAISESETTTVESEPEMSTEIESAQETAEKTEIAVNMLKYGMSRSYRNDFMVKNLNLNNFLKALIKIIGLEKVKEVRYTSQGMNVFFEYHGEMYKCYTLQSKLYKLSGQRFNLITWKDLKKDSSEKSDDNSGSLYTGRSPPESSLLN